jgi:hypothetical protein
MDNVHISYGDSDAAKTLEEALKQDMKRRKNEAWGQVRDTIGIVEENFGAQK